MHLATGLVADHVYVNRDDACGHSYETVWGIEVYGDRIFACLGGREDSEGKRTNGFALAMYRYDPSTGIVLDGSGAQTDTPLQCLSDNNDANDDFPGVFLQEGGRVSWVVHPNDPDKLRLYCGSNNGNVVEVEYDIPGDSMTPLSYWNNGFYREEIMDCNAYIDSVDVEGVMEDTIRVVVSKRAETFEVVAPPDMP